jgi:manganese-dependent inorganic pyrophosphatase
MQEAGRTIYVLGHIRPDADSICAAIAYANLKNRLGYANVRPGRTGPVNPQTRFILNFFGKPVPAGHGSPLHLAAGSRGPGADAPD